MCLFSAPSEECPNEMDSWDGYYDNSDGYFIVTGLENSNDIWKEPGGEEHCEVIGRGKYEIILEPDSTGFHQIRWVFISIRFRTQEVSSVKVTLTQKQPGRRMRETILTVSMF